MVMTGENTKDTKDTKSATVDTAEENMDINVKELPMEFRWVGILVVFQKWRWPCLYRPFKGIAVDEQANDDIVHLCRFRKANGLADQAFNACA